VVLAGGAARRMGGAKATALLGGRPLLRWALDALRDAGTERLAVVAKAGTPLPALDDAEVWIEPDEPRHPLAGVLHALDRAGGAAILTLPVDLPLVPPAVLRALATADLGGAPAAVVRAAGRVEPLVARFTPEVARVLRAEGRATDAVLALRPLVIDVADEGLANVNTAADLAAAEAALAVSRRGRRSGRSAAGRSC
jgi:molybdopterin-guanine dinucleotide biosynthesis protein A